MTCEPIFRLLKKEVPIVWNEQCQEAFEKIKSYLMKPPILVPPAPEKPLLLYLTSIDTAIGALLARYLERLGRRMQFTTSARRCSLMKKKFDIKYVTQEFVKGRAIADHLAHCSPEEAEEIQGDFPDADIMGVEVESWKMYFDGATNQNGSGIEVLLISPKETHIPFSGRLNFPTTNNATEYEACIMGRHATLGQGVKELEVYGDLALIISQIQNKWKIKEERLVPYHECLQK
ncbi:uncharacterized protein LOC142609098 [Castanea sativa]|uniref:uncharacterized protein LOC142609098 n=1 Tax=Castanea sativa TaxID=21020 RepID=UPI003F651EEA